jgi:hypothetical protein
MQGIPFLREGINIANLSKQSSGVVKEFLNQLPRKNLEDNGFHNQVLFCTDLPKRIKLVDAVDSNPYHLFFYMIARFYYADNGSSPVVFHYPKCRTLCHAALSALPPHFVRKLEKEEGVEYVQLPTCDWRYDSINEDWIYSYLRNLYSHVWKNTKQEKGKRIYITRSKHLVERRAVLNEEDLKPVLKGLGVSCYSLEEMTFVDTVRLFKSAELVTGAHGAGLSWLVFCDPGTTVVEIYKYENTKRHFVDLCSRMGLRHSRFNQVEVDGEGVSEDSDMTVNIEAYANFVRNIYAKN